MLPVPAIVSPVFEHDASPIEARFKDQVWLVVKLSPVVGLLLWIPPTRKISVSPIVIEIADIDDLQAVETIDLCRSGIQALWVLTPYLPLFPVIPRQQRILCLWMRLACISLGGVLQPIPFFQKHGPTHEWCQHAFPPATLEALDALSYSHMANDLQYVVAQVTPYLVVSASRLHYMGADLVELAAVKSEHDELAEKVWLLEEERCNFDERYLVLSGEKIVAEAQGVVQVVDRVVENSEFVLGIHYVKVTCVAAGVEKGKQVERMQSVGSTPGSSDLDVVA
ncbi:unnamed protein product [Lactuca saligna]|uniref:Uncharacterized protein n=1 Tax=Lactuca saligna TaxID=75948 RepID=A0AA36E3D8_LACSI|nr:unnamed protein product [Lactuca saligna]